MKRRSFWTVCAAFLAAPWRSFRSTQKPPVADPDVESMETLLGMWAGRCVNDAERKAWATWYRIPMPDLRQRCALDCSGVNRSLAVVAPRIPERPRGGTPVTELMDAVKEKATEAVRHLAVISNQHDGFIRRGSGEEVDLERRQDDPTLFRMRLTVHYRVVPHAGERSARERLNESRPEKA